MINDAVWQTIKDYFAQFYNVQAIDELRAELEKRTDIHPFDGGVFIRRGNEFDLFVEPQRRGRWRIRSEITKYLEQLGKQYGRIVVKVHENNHASLRLAKHFEFKEISRNNGVIELENLTWAV